jgi:hypothetical protein
MKSKLETLTLATISLLTAANMALYSSFVDQDQLTDYLVPKYSELKKPGEYIKK